MVTSEFPTFEKYDALNLILSQSHIFCKIRFDYILPYYPLLPSLTSTKPYFFPQASLFLVKSASGPELSFLVLSSGFLRKPWVGLTLNIYQWS